MIFVKGRTGKVEVVDVGKEETVGELRLREGGAPAKINDTAKGEVHVVRTKRFYPYIIFVRPNGTKIVLRRKKLASTPIGVIKDELRTLCSVPASESLEIGLGSRLLQDDKTLWDYHIEFGERLPIRYVPL